MSKLEELLQLEDRQGFNAFGKMILSQKLTAPAFKFGSSDRNQRAKTYDKMAEKDQLGTASPGPKYYSTLLKQEPEFSIPSGQRFPTQNIQNNKIDDQLIDEADKFRRHKSPKISFGTDARFKSNRRDIDPPYYNPQVRYSTPSAKFGLRLIENQKQYTKAGPGSYSIDKRDKSPSISFNRSHRFSTIQNPRLHDTHSIENSIGKQAISQRKNSPMYSVGKGRRDSEVKILKDELRAKVKLRLHHAPY
ncbi:hypothetical protein pb186bvf_002689 [Paramecium bursaria]